MHAKIVRAEIIDDTHIGVLFSDKKYISYDVSQDYVLPYYERLKLSDYFKSFSIDASGTSIIWDKEVAYPSDMLYENGIEAKLPLDDPQYIEFKKLKGILGNFDFEKMREERINQIIADSRGMKN